MQDRAPPSLRLEVELGSSITSIYHGYLLVTTFARFLTNPIGSITLVVTEETPGTDLDLLREALRDSLAHLENRGPEIPLFLRSDATSQAHAAGSTDASRPSVEQESAYLLRCTPHFFLFDTYTVDRPFHVSGLASGQRLSVASSSGADSEEIPLSQLAMCLEVTSNYFDHTGHLMRPKLEENKRRSFPELGLLLRSSFHNPLFWEHRYRTNIGLGSGVGSRGVHLQIKQSLLNRYVTIHRPSILDFGCGDLEVVRGLAFEDYLGLDVSQEALTLARRKRPDWRFSAASLQDLGDQSFDVVLCFDVLIHVAEASRMKDVLLALAHRARKRMIVSGFDYPVRNAPMTFFHVSLRDMLSGLEGFKPPVRVCAYEDISVYVIDRSDCDYAPAEAMTPLEIASFVWRQTDELQRLVTGHTAQLQARHDVAIRLQNEALRVLGETRAMLQDARQTLASLRSEHRVLIETLETLRTAERFLRKSATMLRQSPLRALSVAARRALPGWPRSDAP